MCYVLFASLIYVMCYVLFASLIVECGCLLHQLLVQMLGRFVLAMSEGLCPLQCPDVGCVCTRL